MSMELFQPIQETDITVSPSITEEMVRLYDEGFCGVEPYWETDAQSAIRSSQTIASQDSHAFILTEQQEDQLFGFLIATSVDQSRFSNTPQENILTTRTRNDVYILELAVDTGLRRNGIGKHLVERAIDIARNTECRGITLRADIRNAPAISFYQKLGFGILVADVSSNPFDVYIRKNVAPSNGITVQPIETEETKNLFDTYPLNEYLFFTSSDEIEGWKRASQSTQTPTQLSSSLWVIPRLDDTISPYHGPS